jgi:hypothetical protein
MRRLETTFLIAGLVVWGVACSPNAGTGDGGATDDDAGDSGTVIVGAVDSGSSTPGSDSGSGTPGSDSGSSTHNDAGTHEGDASTNHHSGCGDKPHEHDDDNENVDVNDTEHEGF